MATPELVAELDDLIDGVSDMVAAVGLEPVPNLTALGELIDALGLLVRASNRLQPATIQEAVESAFNELNLHEPDLGEERSWYLASQIVTRTRRDQRARVSASRTGGCRPATAPTLSSPEGSAPA